jgi:NCAIR mutase (PurE)-related protein
VYKLICKNCPGTYTGQTERNFKTSYKEHVEDIKNNKSRTGFSHHILDTGHTYDNIENTLEILNIQEKNTYLNTLERFHIYKTKKQAYY